MCSESCCRFTSSLVAACISLELHIKHRIRLAQGFPFLTFVYQSRNLNKHVYDEKDIHRLLSQDGAVCLLVFITKVISNYQQINKGAGLPLAGSNAYF